MKHSYLDMIVEAVNVLNERGGVTRQKIWKYISTKKDFQDSISGNQKVFLAQLKRIIDAGTILHLHKTNRSRIVMDPSFRGKLARKVAKG